MLATPYSTCLTFRLTCSSTSLASITTSSPVTDNWWPIGPDGEELVYKHTIRYYYTLFIFRYLSVNYHIITVYTNFDATGKKPRYFIPYTDPSSFIWSPLKVVIYKLLLEMDLANIVIDLQSWLFCIHCMTECTYTQSTYQETSQDYLVEKYQTATASLPWFRILWWDIVKNANNISWSYFLITLRRKPQFPGSDFVPPKSSTTILGNNSPLDGTKCYDTGLWFAEEVIDTVTIILWQVLHAVWRCTYVQVYVYCMHKKIALQSSKTFTSEL